MESSLVSGVGAIATSSSATSCPRLCFNSRRHERLASVGNHDHITRLDVRRGVLKEAEIVPGRVVEAVGRHSLEENPQSRLGRAAAARERRGVMQVDLDVRGEDARRSDVVSGADELLEAPPHDRFRHGFVDQLELDRCHCRLRLRLLRYRLTVERLVDSAAPT